MPVTGFQLVIIIFTAALYFAFFNLNELLFSKLEFVKGVNWIFLPAGLRLLCTLLLGLEGAVGIGIGSIVVILMNFSGFDLISGVGAATISAGAPYLVYRLAIMMGLPTSLQKLSPSMLSVLIVSYAACSAMLHQIWFVLRGMSADLLTNFVAMFIGDLCGTLIIIYVMKIALAAVRMIQRKEA